MGNVKKSRVPASRKTFQRSSSVPVKSNHFSAASVRSAGRKTPRGEPEVLHTPRSTQDKVKHAIERAARRTRPLRAPDLSTGFHRSRSAPALPQHGAQVNKFYTRGLEPKMKRIAQLRKKLHEIVAELEQLEKGSNATPASGLSAGWELAVREAQKKEDYLQGLLNQALEEIKVVRMQRGRAEEELARLRMNGRTSLDEELKDELKLAGCYPGVEDDETKSMIKLKAELGAMQRDRDALRRQLEVYTERSPTKYTMPVKNRDGLKRIELEARCATLESMVKTQEATRAHLLLPNTVRSILANHVADSDVREAIMSDIHVYLQQQSEDAAYTPQRTHSRPTSPSSSNPSQPKPVRGLVTPVKSPRI